MGKCTVQWKQLVIQHIQQISKTKTTHSTRELKNTNSKPKEPAEKKKNPSKRQLFHLPRPMLYNVRSMIPSSSYRWCLLHTAVRSTRLDLPRKQFHPQNSLCQTRSFFFFLNQNTFYRIPNQNVLFKASFFYNIFSSLKDDSHAAV